jgi:hypothetical protein
MNSNRTSGESEEFFDNSRSLKNINYTIIEESDSSLSMNPNSYLSREEPYEDV